MSKNRVKQIRALERRRKGYEESLKHYSFGHKKAKMFNEPGSQNRKKGKS